MPTAGGEPVRLSFFGGGTDFVADIMQRVSSLPPEQLLVAGLLMVLAGTRLVETATEVDALTTLGSQMDVH